MPPERGFAIERAGAQQADEFVRMRMQLFEETAQPDKPFVREPLATRTRAAYLRGMAAGTLIVFVARATNGEALGALALHLFPRLPSPASPTGEEGYIAHVHTRPDWRKRGIGAALMQALLDDARARGLCRLRLHTTEDGRRLYARFGFREHGDNMQLVLGESAAPVVPEDHGRRRESRPDR